MTGNKKDSTAIEKYLFLYNVAQTAGWILIMYRLVGHFMRGEGLDTLWDDIEWPLMIFQNAAVLEVVHVALGFVRSSLFVTFAQVLSRVFVVCGILLPAPPTRSSVGLLMAVSAWTTTEIVRYLFYVFKHANCLPYALNWCRYTFFIVLFPIGLSGELLCMFEGRKYIEATKTWTIEMPNAYNFTFCYANVIILAMVSNIPGFPQIYTYMLRQRKKILGASSSEMKTK